MIEVTRYQRLNPIAAALAAGCTALLFGLILGAPMFGAGMMGGSGMIMHEYGYGFTIAWWFAGALVAALAGAVFAWIYNAFNK